MARAPDTTSCGRASTNVSGVRPTVGDMTTAPVRSRWEEQRSFDELGRALRDVTFCVVDLETTGGSPGDGDMIT